MIALAQPSIWTPPRFGEISPFLQRMRRRFNSWMMAAVPGKGQEDIWDGKGLEASDGKGMEDGTSNEACCCSCSPTNGGTFSIAGYSNTFFSISGSCPISASVATPWDGIFYFAGTYPGQTTRRWSVNPALPAGTSRNLSINGRGYDGVAPATALSIELAAFDGGTPNPRPANTCFQITLACFVVALGHSVLFWDGIKSFGSTPAGIYVRSSSGPQCDTTNDTLTIV